MFQEPNPRNHLNILIDFEEDFIEEFHNEYRIFGVLFYESGRITEFNNPKKWMKCLRLTLAQQITGFIEGRLQYSMVPDMFNGAVWQAEEAYNNTGYKIYLDFAEELKIYTKGLRILQKIGDKLDSQTRLANLENIQFKVLKGKQNEDY